MKKITLLFIFILTGMLQLSAQQYTIEGLVFDKDSRQRLTRVYIYNLGTNKGVFNNTKGEFRMEVNPSDTLVAALEGYTVDTITVRNQKTIIFYLKRISILLKEVYVKDSVRSPRKQLEETQDQYRDAYRRGNPGDLISVGGANGLGGAGLSVDALYSLLSREGKNARYLQEIIERDYRESIINYRFTKQAVRSVTGLEGENLQDFMEQYRPSYYFILEANDYSLLKYIKESYKQYLKNPAAYRLPPLVE